MSHHHETGGDHYTAAVNHRAMVTDGLHSTPGDRVSSDCAGTP